MFYFKHVEKDIFICKLYSLDQIKHNQYIERYYDEGYARNVNNYLYKDEFNLAELKQ
jgi:hypothetical protein